jgi:hypothetical protein
MRPLGRSPADSAPPATIAATRYNGFGFYFGPNCGRMPRLFWVPIRHLWCVTGAAMDIQVQMTPNYPLNDNDKGTM